MFDFTAVGKSVQELKDRLRQINEEIQDLQRRRNAIESAPAAKADVKQLLDRWVDASAATFLPAMRQVVDQYARRPAQIPASDERLLRSNLTLHGTGLNAPPDMPTIQIDRVLCGLFGPQIKQALAAVIDQMDWPASGLTLAERAVKVQQVDRELERLYQEDTGLRDKAGEAGLIV